MIWSNEYYDNANYDVDGLQNIKMRILGHTTRVLFPSDSYKRVVCLRFSKFTTLCSNHHANHCTTTANHPDTNHRTIHSYLIRRIDTWEIERISQCRRQTAVSRFLHSPLTRYLSVLFTTATRECNCLRKPREANHSFFFLVSFPLRLPGRLAEPEERHSLAETRHYPRLLSRRRETRLPRPERSTIAKAKTIVDACTIRI